MLRHAPPRRRARSALVMLSLVGLVASPLGAQAHDDDVTGHNPANYGTPHAGWVAPPAPKGKLAPSKGTLFGTHSKDSHSGELTPEFQHILETEEALGFNMHIDNSYYGSFSSISDDWDPANIGTPHDKPANPDKRGLSKLAYWDVTEGRVPLIGWGCARSTAITAGDYDTVIERTADAFKYFGHEVFMRYCWEMDGDKRSEPGTASQFTAAWAHIWEIFQARGATNVVWVWCANANSFKHQTDNSEWAWDFYPGDRYVDWVSADGYNWGVSRRNDWGTGTRDRWRGFIEIYDEFMVWARSTGGPVPQSMRDDDSAMPERFPRKLVRKPIMIGEYAAMDVPADEPANELSHQKAKWLKETHETVNGDLARTAECPHCGIFSDIGAIVYFDINADAAHQNGDWRILSSPESVSAVVASVSNQPWYRNSIHLTGWGPAANRSDAPKVTPPPVNPPPPAGGGPTTPPPSGGGTTTRPPAGRPDPVVEGRSAGYWMVDAAGNTYAFGAAEHLGNAPVSGSAVDLEATPSGKGYWVVDGQGGVYALGDAGFHGAVGDLPAGETVTSLSATPSGNGYWVFTNRGRVATFGDATSYGDMSDVTLNGPVLDSIPTPSGKGYYMVGSDGGIFAFGDARFYGSMGGIPLNAPVQSLVPDSDGAGYWLVASDGGVFAFDTPFKGSMGGTPLARPVTGMVGFGDGYLMVGEDGGIFNFSTKPFLGSLGDNPPLHPVSAVAALG